MPDETRALPQTKSELLARIARGRVEFEALLGKSSDAQLTAPGKDGWRIQDHLIHLAVWELGVAALLRRASRFGAMGVDGVLLASGDFDAMNDAIYRQHKDKTLAEARAYLRDAQRAILDAIVALADADLQRPYAYFQPDEAREDGDEPIVRWIVGNTFGHYAEHAEWIQAMAGKDK